MAANGQSWKVLYNHSAGYLNDIFFLDILNGWTVGRGGIVLKTSDGGHTWDNLDIGTDTDLSSIFFSTPANGWIVGSNGTIFHTPDTGKTWVSQNSKTSYILSEIFFVNDEVGWAVGSSTVDGIILATEDGGENWSEIGEDLSGAYLGVFLLSEREGWVVGGVSLFDNLEEEIIWHTSDAGSSWVRQESPTSGPLIEVYFLNEEVGWAVGYNEAAIRTSDGGLSWESVDVTPGPDVTNFTLSDIALIGADHIWVMGLESIYFSGDGGQSWNVQWDWEHICPFSFARISMVDSLHGWAVGDTTVLGYSNNLAIGTSFSSTALLSKTYLGPIHPNPFNLGTSISYNLSEPSHVSLYLYDILGRRVLTLFEGFAETGPHKTQFRTTDLSSGIYLVQLSTPEFVDCRKVLLLR